jgi:predicted DNA-binding transcriptional regulator AlpA
MSDNPLQGLNPLQVFTRPATLKLLNLSLQTFNRLPDPPPKIQLSPGRVGYRASDLAAWLDARRQQKTA